jgi:hypothetical protein
LTQLWHRAERGKLALIGVRPRGASHGGVERLGSFALQRWFSAGGGGGAGGNGGYVVGVVERDAAFGGGSLQALPAVRVRPDPEG